MVSLLPNDGAIGDGRAAPPPRNPGITREICVSKFQKAAPTAHVPFRHEWRTTIRVLATTAVAHFMVRHLSARKTLAGTRKALNSLNVSLAVPKLGRNGRRLAAEVHLLLGLVCSIK